MWLTWALWAALPRLADGTGARRLGAKDRAAENVSAEAAAVTARVRGWGEDLPVGKFLALVEAAVAGGAAGGSVRGQRVGALLRAGLGLAGHVFRLRRKEGGSSGARTLAWHVEGSLAQPCHYWGC